MVKINLRVYYPFYSNDTFLESLMERPQSCLTLNGRKKRIVGAYTDIKHIIPFTRAMGLGIHLLCSLAPVRDLKMIR